jgi:hypothetical protein
MATKMVIASILWRFFYLLQPTVLFPSNEFVAISKKLLRYFYALLACFHPMLRVVAFEESALLFLVALMFHFIKKYVCSLIQPRLITGIWG